MKRIMALLLSVALLVGMMPMAFAARDTSGENTLAEDLKQLGLFKGVSETNFDLNRAPTRVEALVMLIRVLGNETEALNGTWKHPFTDVPAWADKYVGFGYEKGLSNGVGATTFGTGTANAAMYITFVLRALGYSDKNGDFTWDKPFELAKEIGVLTDAVNTESFWRADVVLVSHAALGICKKDSTKTLADTLIEAGVFTKEKFDEVFVGENAEERDDEKSEEKTAYDKVVEFIVKNTNTTLGEKKAFAQSYVGSGNLQGQEMAHALIYNEKEDCIEFFVMLTDNNLKSVASVSTYAKADVETIALGYSFSAEEIQIDYTLSGVASKTDVSEKLNINFQNEDSISASDSESSAIIARSLLLTVLAWADDVLEEANVGVAMKDLGFTNLYNK